MIVEQPKCVFTSRLMAASEAIPKVLAGLLGDVYRKLSAMYATNDFTDAHIKREQYWQGKN